MTTRTRPIRRRVALAAALSVLALTACGQAAVTPPVAFPVGDLPAVAHPPTPDPPVDPAVPEPQVWLSPLYLSHMEINAVGDGRVEFVILGSVPTPCHSVKASVTRATGEGALDMAVWSEAPADQICNQLLTSIGHVVAVDGLEAGTYIVRMDGADISEITLSGALGA